MGDRYTESAYPNGSAYQLPFSGTRGAAVVIVSDDEEVSSAIDSSDEDVKQVEVPKKEESSSSNDKKRKRSKSVISSTATKAIREDAEKAFQKSTDRFFDAKTRAAIFKIRLDGLNAFALAKNWGFDELTEAIRKLQNEIFGDNNNNDDDDI